MADHQHRDQDDPDGVHLAHRGTPAQAARMLRQIIGRDDGAPDRHHFRRAAGSAGGRPHHRPSKAVTQWYVTYQKAQRAQRDNAIDRELGLHRTTSLGRSAGRVQSRERNLGYDLSL